MRVARSHLVVLVAAVPLMLASIPATAVASTNPGPVDSSYSFDTTLNGATHFTVYGNGRASIFLAWRSGIAEKIKVQVEQQTCGFFGCHWRGRRVGGTCYVQVIPHGGGRCTLTIGNTNTLNRFVLAKRFDGQTITGSAEIS